MAGSRHPSSEHAAQQLTAQLTFVAALTFNGIHRGLAGPFESEDAADEWAVSVIDDEPGWTWTVEPVVAPSALPTAADRANARAARRRHLSVVR